MYSILMTAVGVVCRVTVQYTDDSCRDSLWGRMYSILMTAVGIVCEVTVQYTDDSCRDSLWDDCSVY